MYQFPSNQICIIDPFVIYMRASSLLKDRVSTHGMSIQNSLDIRIIALFVLDNKSNCFPFIEYRF